MKHLKVVRNNWPKIAYSIPGCPQLKLGLKNESNGSLSISIQKKIYHVSGLQDFEEPVEDLYNGNIGTRFRVDALKKRMIRTKAPPKATTPKYNGPIHFCGDMFVKNSLLSNWHSCIKGYITIGYHVWSPTLWGKILPYLPGDSVMDRANKLFNMTLIQADINQFLQINKDKIIQNDKVMLYRDLLDIRMKLKPKYTLQQLMYGSIDDIGDKPKMLSIYIYCLCFYCMYLTCL